MYDDDLVRRFNGRVKDVIIAENNTDITEPRTPRFNVGWKTATCDDCRILNVALFDGIEIIDCSKYEIPSNAVSKEAMNRWGTKKISEFRQEIIEAIF